MSQGLIHNPAAPLSMPDVNAAVYGFIQTYCLPALREDCIISGNQNRFALPDGGVDYAVFTILNTARIGSNKETHHWDPNTEDDLVIETSELKLMAVQFDFYGEDARQRADTVEMLSRSDIGVNWFRAHRIGCQYATDPTDQTGVDGSEQFVTHFSVDLCLTAWATFSVTVPWFDDVDLQPKVLV